MNVPVTVPIALPLTIYHAAELKEFLVDALERGPRLRFDLSAVSELDCAGVQLLVATRRCAADRQHACEFVGASEVVQATLARLGVPEALMRTEPSGELLAAFSEAAVS